MVINHNIPSLAAYGYFKSNNLVNAKSLEKLSTGQRINRAADDAAGLSISEKMRGQIRGLDQAKRNAQDGISLIQTAEGGLNETHSIIQRVRELAVQAANDTNTKSDRQAIQKEVDQLVFEVDRIANTTEFNTKKLLNSGGPGSDTITENVLNGLKHGWLELAEKNVEAVYGLTGQGSQTSGTATDLQVFLDQGSPYGELAHVGGTSSTLELHIDMSDFAKGDWQNGTNNLGKGFYDDRILAHEMVHAVMDDSLGVIKMNSIQTWFAEGTAEFSVGADERLKNVIGTSGALDAAKLNNLVSRATDLLNGATWNGDDLDYSAGYVITKYLDQNLSGGNTFKNVMADIKSSGAAGDAAVQNAIATDSSFGSFASFISNFQTNASNYVQTGVTLNWGSDEVDTGSISGSDHGGSSLNAEDIINESLATDTSDGQPLAHFQVVWPSDSENNSNQPVLLIGANSGQTMVLQMRDMRATALGLANLDLTTSKGASNAITNCDGAIASVATFRSQLGAYQNRLEHTLRNLEQSSTNLQAAESRIRDVDMASEMTNYTKTSILMQASQAMLAQANQMPQGILQLLR